MVSAEKIMPPIFLPCGGVAHFDHQSGCSYVCAVCFCTVGSVGMPRSCQDDAKKYDTWKMLGGKDWDYTRPARGIHNMALLDV